MSAQLSEPHGFGKVGVLLVPGLVREPLICKQHLSLGLGLRQCLLGRLQRPERHNG